jgi:hypothetical protein
MLSSGESVGIAHRENKSAMANGQKRKISGSGSVMAKISERSGDNENEK